MTNHLVTPEIKTDISVMAIEGKKEYRIAISDRCCSMYWKVAYFTYDSKPSKKFIDETVSSALELFKMERLKHRMKMIERLEKYKKKKHRRMK